MIHLSPFVKRMAWLVCGFWSVCTYADPGPNGYCKPVIVRTWYESQSGQPGKIATGVNNSGLIGKIWGSFRFTCKTHRSWHYSDGVNFVSLGTYFAGSGASYINGTKASYRSNIKGIIFKLPAKEEVTFLAGGTGMIRGNPAQEGDAIVLERYSKGAGFERNDVFTRTYNRVPIFYVYQTGAVPSFGSLRQQQIWLESPVTFGSYLHTHTPSSSYQNLGVIHGPMITLYDPSCRKRAPASVEFDKVMSGRSTQKPFSIGIECPKDTSGNNLKNVTFSFDLMSSPGVSVEAGNPTVIVYNKDGVKVRLSLQDRHDNKAVVFGKKTALSSYHPASNNFDLAFKANLTADDVSKAGKYEINVISNIEYN